MLKKIALVATLALVSTSAFADQDIGCGVGSTLFAGKEGKVFKILGATTNGIFMNQLFGISFGTLGCQGDGKITAQVAEFVDGNGEALARDMAVGQGENLEVLAQLLHIAPADQAHFYSVAKSEFANIYTADATTASVVTALHQVMANDAILKSYTL